MMNEHPDARSQIESAGPTRGRGANFLAELVGAIPDFVPEHVFDVGANVGDVALEFTQCFPQANIYCFEPVEATFHELERRLADASGCRCFCIGMGAAEEPVEMVFDPRHSNRARIRQSGAPAEQLAEPVEVVTASIETLDAFCARREIDRIDLLKVDTEGYDLEVLKGSQRMLDGGRVKVIIVEAGMNPDNALHVPFVVLCDYLRGFGFYLFGIYDQQREWTRKLPHLRRADLAFINTKSFPVYETHPAETGF